MAEPQWVISFNGINNRLALSKSFPNIDKAITIEFWAKGENSLEEKTSILEAYNFQNTRVLQISLPGYDSPDTSIIWDAGNEQGFDRIEKKIKLTEYNVWTHWAFVKNAVTGRMYIYRNGAIWHRGNGHNRSINGIDKLVIGSTVEGENYWKGSLAELYIWHRARTQMEIQKDMNRRLIPPKDKGLSAYLSFDKDAYDQTTYENHGILYGTTWSLDKLPIILEKKSRSNSNTKTTKTTQPKMTMKSQKNTTNNPESTTELPPESTTELPPELTTELTSESATELTPESATELTPESTTELTSESTTELTPESTTELTSELTTELTSESTTEIAEISESNPILESLLPELTSDPTQLSSPKQKKRLIVCCDGIWNEKVSNHPTNVVKFARFIKHITTDQTPQIVSYLSGCGTATDRDLIESLGGGAFGFGIDRIIQEAYQFLCMNYDGQAQDEIYLVGFSRGAYIVRCLTDMIDKCGLLKREKIREISTAYQLYRDSKINSNHPQAQKFREENSQQIDTEKDYLQYRVPIKMLGCWDAVGLLGIPDVTPWFPIAKLWNQRYEFTDLKLSPIIENAFHAIAIDEKRKIFPSTPMKTHEKNPEQNIKEVLFVGEHGCIGGINKQSQGLSDYPLQWMIKQAENLGLEFTLETHDQELQINPDPTTKFDNSVTGFYAFGGEAWRPLNFPKVIVHHSVVKRLNSCPDYRPKNLEPLFKDLLENHPENDTIESGII